MQNFENPPYILNRIPVLKTHGTVIFKIHDNFVGGSKSGQIKQMKFLNIFKN